VRYGAGLRRLRKKLFKGCKKNSSRVVKKTLQGLQEKLFKGCKKSSSRVARKTLQGL
jgi:hypothetical protein